jgi:hypothetical protein
MPKASRKKSKPKYRNRGPHGLSVPEAGALIGLGRNASYAAANDGRIPVLKIGALKIVPRGLWLKQIGADDKAERDNEAGGRHATV